MTKLTDHDLETYPHVILTSDMDWDPSILDNEVDLDVIEQYLEEFPLIMFMVIYVLTPWEITGVFILGFTTCFLMQHLL